MLDLTATPSPVDAWRKLAHDMWPPLKVADALREACDRIEALDKAIGHKDRIGLFRESSDKWRSRAELAEARVKELEAHFQGCQECHDCLSESGQVVVDPLGRERRAVEAESRLAIAVEVIEALLNKVNRVTAPWRHQHGNVDAGVMDAAIDALSSRQIEVEAHLAKLKEPAT